MKKKFLKENIIVIDLEFTCWRGRPPKGNSKEIVEIGICEIDILTNKIIKVNSIIIKINSKVSSFCTELTSITQKDVDERGITLQQAFNFISSEYNSKQKTWCSWGVIDKYQINNECQEKLIVNPFSINYFDLQKEFTKTKEDKKRIFSVENALKEMNLEFIGKKHTGKDDSYNTARIFLEAFK